MNDEDALLRRARTGDLGAFNELVLSYQGLVFSVCLRFLESHPAAEDATQEAFVAAWRKLPSLREPAKFDAWLDQITVNACRMALRKRKGVHELRLMPEADLPAVDRSAAQANATAIAFDVAFERLSVEQRALLLEHHLDGLGVDELGRRLGIPAGTVKSRLFAARRALEAALKDVER